MSSNSSSMASPSPLKTLRLAAAPAAATVAMDQALDRLIATSSLAETQQLTLALQRCAARHSSALPVDCLVLRLRQATAICAEPPSKAEFLGSALLHQTLQLAAAAATDNETPRRLLLEVFSANPRVLSGFVAALTSVDGPLFSRDASARTAEVALTLVAPVFKAVLADETQSAGHKALVLGLVSRAAWCFDAEDAQGEAVRVTAVRMLIQALELTPRTSLSEPVCSVLTALATDLLGSLRLERRQHVALAAQMARLLLEITRCLLEQDVGALGPLQAIEQLAQTAPHALWSSDFILASAHLLTATCVASCEQKLMLRVLTHTLEFGRETQREAKTGAARRAYVEALVLPLASMLASHATESSYLLTLVVEIKAKQRFQSSGASLEEVAGQQTESATHAQLAVRLVSHEKRCEAWLETLFLTVDSGASPSDDTWLALLLVALLSDERPRLRAAVARSLERQRSNAPKFWSADATKTLVASLVFLVSQRPPQSTSTGNAKMTKSSAEWVVSCLYSLAALAATTTDTMRIVLRLIDSMNGTTKTRAMALTLMLEVWRKESRVFPRLESMLLEPTTTNGGDVERHIVRMATIKALCESDAEQGVQFISVIQEFLEDELTSVVAMAMDSIAALCAADCLDFYVAFKIISLKMRKHKVLCVDEPLFQERLCCFYALGAGESTSHEKHAAKLLAQAWEFTDSDDASVRRAAYFSLTKFPLEMLGLCLPSADSVDSDDEEVTEEEVEEQLDDLMQRLEDEQDAGVRAEIENLVTRILEHESSKLTAGVGRGQRMSSAASGSVDSGSTAIVSAAATKELRKLLPSSEEVTSMYPFLASDASVADWSGFLLAYRPKASIDAQNVKRKDKLVRLATQNVEELEQTVAAVLPLVQLPWVVSDGDTSCEVFLQIQTLMAGWKGFMATYVASLEELADLKRPTGVDDADVSFRVFSAAVEHLTTVLLEDDTNKLGGALAAGALAGELYESRHWKHAQLRVKYEETVAELSRRLAQAVEESRVFAEAGSDARSSIVGATIALQLAFGRQKVDADEDGSNFLRQLKKLETTLTTLALDGGDQLLRSLAVLALSHIGILYMAGDELEDSATLQMRQQRARPVASCVLATLLGSNSAQRHQAMSNGDSVFPQHASMDKPSSTDKMITAFKTSGSSDMLVLRWAAFMALARLSSGFASVKRLDWLANLRAVLSAMWEAEGGTDDLVAIALGPVLLESVQLNTCPSRMLETFVATCIERAAACGMEEPANGFLMMAMAHVLCRLEACGGFVSTVQDQTKLLVERIHKALQDDISARATTVRALMLAAVAGLFHETLGVSGLFSDTAKQNRGLGVELSLDMDTIATLVEVVRVESAKDAAQIGLSRAVLGALASAADSFYVSHKKKSFDVEIRSLPTKSLVFKALEWLREAVPAHEGEGGSTRMATSVLACLAKTGSTLPLLDYASLTRRVMLRFCCVDVSVQCVRFAVTQGSCDALMVSDWLSATRFRNASPIVQAELIAGLSLVATRIETEPLQQLLVAVFTVFVDMWQLLGASPDAVLLFDSWSHLLRVLLDSETKQRASEDSLAMVNQLVLEKFTPGLPFGPHDTPFVHKFATRVLTKVNFGGQGAADTLLLAAPSLSTWSWWRSGVFVVELARVGVLEITKREASLMFQWVLRHDFDEWTDATLVVQYLEPLAAQIGALVARHTRPEAIVSSLLDALDAFSRSMAASNSGEVFKRRILLDLVACVCSWRLSQSHEQFLLTTAQSTGVVEGEGGRVVSKLLPFGLSLTSPKVLSALSERLWELLQQLTRDQVGTATAEEVTAYVATLRGCSLQVYVAGASEQLSSSLRAGIRELWSLREA